MHHSGPETFKNPMLEVFINICIQVSSEVGGEEEALAVPQTFKKTGNCHGA